MEKIDDTRHSLLDEIEYSKLMSERHKEVCRA